MIGRGIRAFPFCVSGAILGFMGIDAYWASRTIQETMDAGYSHLRAVCGSCNRVSEIPWGLLLQRRGVTKDSFIGNLRLKCQHCGNREPSVSVKHHGNTQGYGKA